MYTVNNLDYRGGVYNHYGIILLLPVFIYVEPK